MGLVHGGDFVFAGGQDALEGVSRELGKTVLLKATGRLGGDKAAGDLQEARCLNRVVRWTDTGITVEADPRLAELLAATFGPEA
eukprot:14652196-Alexandrium_andersonii.AAC.1